MSLSRLDNESLARLNPPARSANFQPALALQAVNKYQLWRAFGAFNKVPLCLWIEARITGQQGQERVVIQPISYNRPGQYDGALSGEAFAALSMRL